MAYTKHTWVCGEVINDAKMNNIEDGIEEALECCESGGTFVMEIDHTSGSTVYLNKTYQELEDAITAGKNAWFSNGTGKFWQILRFDSTVHAAWVSDSSFWFEADGADELLSISEMA